VFICCRLSNRSDVTYIAVHIRRTDMLKFAGEDYGVVYLYKSVEYMLNRFHDRCLLFVVCSDNMTWSQTNFEAALSINTPVFSGKCLPQVTFFAGRNAAQDMTVLVSCNHTILTMGTFGWWSAYLAGGLVIYSKKYPPDWNPLYKKALMTRSSDVNLPSWIGLS
jgi:galactoside 2-L-fucosyltransferase 1/2